MPFVRLWQFVESLSGGKEAGQATVRTNDDAKVASLEEATEPWEVVGRLAAARADFFCGLIEVSFLTVGASCNFCHRFVLSSNVSPCRQ